MKENATYISPYVSKIKSVDIFEVHDMARTNALRSMTHVLFSALCIALIAVLNLSNIELIVGSAPESVQSILLLKIGKWVSLVVLLVYLLLASSHFIRAIGHIRQAKFLINSGDLYE